MALHAGKAAGLTPYPILQMANTKVQKGDSSEVPQHIKAVRTQDGGVLPGEATTSEDKSSLQMLCPASSSLLPTPGEGNAPHPAMGQAVQYHQPPLSHLQIYKDVGEMGAGAQLVKHYLLSSQSPQELRSRIIWVQERMAERS